MKVDHQHECKRLAAMLSAISALGEGDLSATARSTLILTFSVCNELLGSLADDWAGLNERCCYEQIFGTDPEREPVRELGRSLIDETADQLHVSPEQREAAMALLDALLWIADRMMQAGQNVHSAKAAREYIGGDPAFRESLETMPDAARAARGFIAACVRSFRSGS